MDGKGCSSGMPPLRKAKRLCLITKAARIGPVVVVFIP